MNVMSVENISVNFGERRLFQNVSFGLDKGERVALIASNGTGKTTLMNILAGFEIPDAGNVVLRDSYRLGYLRQEPVFDFNISIEETISKANSFITSIIHNYKNALEIQAVDFSEQASKKVEECSRLMDMYQAWDYERRLIEILTKFQMYNLSQKVGTLSGGQLKRLALATVLIDSPDILLLDEPTNHMDIDMIEWLEEFLLQSGKTLFIVSHDRYFLDTVCTKIIEMEGEQIFIHNGNYAYYLEKSEERKTILATEVAKAQQLFKKELDWMRTQPRARTHKSKSRIDSFYEIEKKAKSAVIKQELVLDFKMSRLGNKILELINISKSYGDKKLIDNFSYTFTKGDRIGIVGSNGSGKTTLLNILSGKIRPDAGKIIKGETIQIGYFTQAGIKFDETKKVIDVVTDIAEEIILSDGKSVSASQFLKFFMFPPKMQQNLVSKLSGGEKRRLHLLTVLVKNPNFLILDEPTNDLDLPTLNTLELFLEHFKGCLILVSHDRYFLDTLTDHIFIFNENATISDFYDTYTAFRELRKQKIKNQTNKNDTQKFKKSQLKSETNRKPTWKETKEFENILIELDDLENEKRLLEKKLELYASDAEKVYLLSEQYASVIQKIDEKSMRWLELSEIITK